MKIKLLLLIIGVFFITYKIYNYNYTKKINITSINSLLKENNYNFELAKLLEKDQNIYNYNIDFSNEYMEIENLIGKINNNYNNLLQILHNSDISIISVGDIDYKTEKLSIILEELKELFSIIRKINTKEIIYISPYNIKNTLHIKELCKKYNIIFINGNSFNNKILLSKQIYLNIKTYWNKEKD